jgi:FKBP-type peptidyl-prolyl cis-trans isomerase 2
MKFDRKEIQTTLQRLTQSFVCLLMLAGCATQGTHQTLQPDQGTDGATQGRHVQPGDRVSVRYLCRLRSGEVVAATDGVAEIQWRSNVYLQREAAGPLSIEAVSAVEAAQTQARPYEQPSFEGEISHQLALAIIGMKEGDTHMAELKAEDAPAREARKYIAHLTRVRTRPKEMKMPKGDYEYRTHKSPEAGQEFDIDPDFPGKVESVSDNEVTIKFFATPVAVIETPFGPGRIREEDREYKMDIDARKGALVRVDAIVGRISDVDEKVITIDFGNPFGGETLLCKVTVEKIMDAKSAQSGE